MMNIRLVQCQKDEQLEEINTIDDNHREGLTNRLRKNRLKKNIKHPIDISNDAKKRKKQQE